MSEKRRVTGNPVNRPLRFGNVRVVSDGPDNDEQPGGPGNVAAVMAGGAAAIAGVRLGPEVAIPAGMLAYRFEPMVDKALAELRPDTRRRAGQMLDAAAETIGCDADQLDKMIGESDRTRLMTGLALVPAQPAFWRPQEVGLG